MCCVECNYMVTFYCTAFPLHSMVKRKVDKPGHLGPERKPAPKKAAKAPAKAPAKKEAPPPKKAKVTAKKSPKTKKPTRKAGE